MEFGPRNDVIFSTGCDRAFQVWNPSTGVHTERIDTDAGAVSALAFAPDGKSIAVGYGPNNGLQRQVKTRATLDGRQLGEYGESALDGSVVTSLGFCAGGTNLAVGYGPCGGSARVFELAHGNRVLLVDGAMTRDYVAVSPTRSHLFVADNYAALALRIFDAQSFLQITNIPSPWSGGPSNMCGMACLASSPTGTNVLIGHTDQVLRMWEWATRKVVWKANAHISTINRVAFSPDGNLVVSVSDDQTIKIWDAATGELRHTLTGHGAAVKDVGFSPSGAVIASVGGDTVRFWDPITGQQLGYFDAETKRVSAVAFSPDGAFVAYGRTDPVLVLARNPFFVPPRLSVTHAAGGNAIDLTVTNLPASGYTLESSLDLETWSDDETPLSINGTFSVPVSSDGVRRFYRIRLN